MKRNLIGALLGLTVSISAFGQGHILVSNYVDPYYQVYFNPDPIWALPGKANMAVHQSDNLQFRVFYTYGSVTDPAAVNIPGLTFGINDLFNWDPLQGHGGGGYFTDVDQIFSTWSSGPVTLKYAVITEGYIGESAVWVESSNVRPTSGPPIGNVGPIPGLMVSLIPEPSAFSLLGRALRRC